MSHITIITTVGTSMFTNYKRNDQYQTAWNRIRTETFSDSNWQGLTDDIEEIQTAIEDWNQFSCAELDTIEAIKHSYGKNVEHHLLCSETIAGVLAGKILEKKLDGVKSNDIIEKLQTNIVEDFKETVFLKLVETVQGIAQPINLERQAIAILKALDTGNIKDFRKVLEEKINDEPFKTLFTKEKETWKDHINSERVAKEIAKIENKKVVINYSGGYKAVIPYLTILGQLYNYDLAYMHEDSNRDAKGLIDVKRLPFNFDVSLAEQFYPYLDVLSYTVRDEYALTGNDIQLTKDMVIDKAELQIEQMKAYQLLDNENKVTAFGTLILNYIKESNAISKSTLGFYCEYKMFEYFYDHHKDDYLRIERSFEPKKDDKRNPGIKYIGDADLRLDVKLDDSETLFDWVEIKGFGGLFERKNDNFRVIQRISDRHAYKTDNFEGKQINKYKFIFYKHEHDSLDLVLDIIKEMKSKFVNVEVYYFTIKLNQNNNPFQSFMQNKMAKDDF